MKRLQRGIVADEGVAVAVLDGATGPGTADVGGVGTGGGVPADVVTAVRPVNF